MWSKGFLFLFDNIIAEFQIQNIPIKKKQLYE